MTSLRPGIPPLRPRAVERFLAPERFADDFRAGDLRVLFRALLRAGRFAADLRPRFTPREDFLAGPRFEPPRDDFLAAMVRAPMLGFRATL